LQGTFSFISQQFKGFFSLDESFFPADVAGWADYFYCGTEWVHFGTEWVTLK
jgi:hypothetical protein